MSDKIIGGIKEIHQFMEGEGNFLLPYAPAYLRLLQALGAPAYMDYNFVLCVSGAATRVSWQQGWAEYKDEPNQSEIFINGDRLTEYRKGFSGAGVEAEIYLNEAKRDWWNGNYSGSVTWTEEITLYCIVTGFTPRAVDKKMLCEVMANVVYLARLKKPEKDIPGKHVSFGLDAVLSLSEHLVWDEGFDPLEAGKKYEGDLSWQYDRPNGFWREDGARSLGDRFWAGYCDFLCMLNGFETLKLFIEKHIGITPEWSADLEEAVRCAHRVADYTGELWKTQKSSVSRQII